MRIGHPRFVRALLAAALLAALLPTSAFAAVKGVTAHLASSFVYAGDSFRVDVALSSDAADRVTGLSLDAPKGFDVEGPQSAGERVTSINGNQTAEYDYEFVVRPPSGASGAYPIGPLHVTLKSGASETVSVGKIEVGRRPPRGARMKAVVTPPSGPVAMPFLVRYVILYSGRPNTGQTDFFGNSRSPLGLTSLSLPVLQDGNVTVQPVEPKGSGRVIRLRLGRGNGPWLYLVRGHEDTKEGVYATIEFSLKVYPQTTEDVDLSATAGFSLVVGTRTSRDVFGDPVRVPASKTFSLQTGKVVYVVKELPQAGQPDDFTGAVGRFSISAKPSPTKLSAYDPMVVTVTISGKGLLDNVSLPDWGSDPSIKKDFDVSSDVVPGKVHGDEKVFHVTFRPKSPSVTAFPALPFPYYDPWKKTYEVARSAPVPLTVLPVKTVTASQSVGSSSAPSAAPAPGRITSKLGIGANYDTLGDVEPRIRARPPLFTPAFYALLVLPPLLILVALFLRSRARRPKGVARGTTLSRALSALAAKPPAEKVATIVGDYLRDRLDLSLGEITTRDLVKSLQARVVPPELVDRSATFWDGISAARFGASDSVPEDVGGWLRELDRCLR